MQRRLIQLLFFMSASLAAMNHEGAWDEQGNYLGPIPQANDDQSYVPQVMMMPQLVYMPVYVDQFGQQVPFMPTMPHAMPYQMPIMMPHQFPMMYQPQQFVEPLSDQWTVPAPEQTIIADANPAAPSRESTTPTLQAASSSSSTSPTAPAPAEQGALARQVEVLAQEDQEVEAITARMESVAVADTPSAEKSAPAPIVHWADVQDSPSPTLTPTIAVVADDAKNDIPVALPSDPMIPEPHVSSSSASTSSTPSTSRSLSPQPKPAVISYLQAVQAKKNNPLPLRPVAASSISSNSIAVSSTNSNPKRSYDERLQDALAELGTSKVTDRVSQLTRNKFEWINTLASESDRMKEWEKFAQLLQQSGALSVEAQVPEQATSLFNVATTLVEQLKNIDKKSTARKKFARLAVQCVSSASGALPAHLIEQASRVSDQAAALLESKKGAQDQSNISEEEFYAGYTIAQEKPARQKKAAKQVAQPTVVQVVKKAAAKKIAPQPKKDPKKNKEPKKQQPSAPSMPQVAPPKPPQPSLEERIEKLLSGTRAQCKEGFALLEQVAEGAIADADPAYRVRAMRRAADFYLYGYTPDKAMRPFVEQNLKRSEYFLSKAISIDEKVSDLQSMVLLSFEQGREKVVEYANRLEVHAESTDQMKRFARLLRASAQIMDDEENQLTGDAFATFMAIHNDFGLSQSMLPVSNVLPKTFWEWMNKRVISWVQELKCTTDTQLDQKTYARLEWTYLLGRLYIDAQLEGSARLTDSNFLAMGWIKTAADYGNPHAQLYLAKPIRTGQPTLSLHERMFYLRAALGSDKPRTKEELKYAERVCEEYARQGFLAPLSDYLCLCTNAGRLDEALESFKDNFPAIKIPSDNLKTCVFAVAQEVGLIDELQKRASDSWIVRAILSALEISEFRDNTIPVSNVTVARIDNALTRIQADVHDHPQLESLVAAGYSTRAFVLKRISAEVSFGTLNQGIQLMKRVCRDYEEAIKRGDSFGKIFYGTGLLSTNINLVQKATSIDNLYAKGLELLQEVVDGHNEEGKLSVLEFLIAHYVDRQDWRQVDKYLATALEYARSIYHHDQVEYFEKSKKMIQSKRNKSSQSYKEVQKRLAVKQEQSYQNGEIIQRLKQADEYVVSALGKTHTRPFEALEDLRAMEALNMQQQLSSNPRMIALCYMVLDDLSEVAADSSLIQESARAEFLRMLDPFYHTMGQASLEYQSKSSKPGYQKDKFEELLRAYLGAYHLRERVMLYIKEARTASNTQALKSNEGTIANMMSLWDHDQQDEYLRICKEDTVKKREVYQAALKEEEVMLNALLEKL